MEVDRTTQFARMMVQMLIFVAVWLLRGSAFDTRWSKQLTRP
jgi:hypothetical protein